MTIVTVFIVAVIIFFVGVYYNSPYRWTYSQAYPKPAANGALSWTFDPARDSRRYGLNQSQCDAAFAKLWLELDRAAHHQDKTGKIMPEEHGISWSRQGTVRAMIHNHQVRGDICLMSLPSLNRRPSAYSTPALIAIYPRGKRMHTIRLSGAVQCHSAFHPSSANSLP